MSQYMWQQSIDKHLANLESDLNNVYTELSALPTDDTDETFDARSALLLQVNMITEEIYQTKQRDYFNEYADYQYDQMKERQLKRGY